MFSLSLPDRPHTTIHPDRASMGAAAARLVQDELAQVVARKGHARIVMACAPSQDDYYAALIPLANATPGIWSRVHVFHMDDYVGLTAAHPQSFRHYLQTHFLAHIAVAAFHLLQAEAADIEAEARRYDAALAADPIDVISFGIGENGHLAFNDPPVADFADPVRVKIVELDPICRQQQVNDGCFPTVDAVPRHALTLTLPVFASAGLLACIVPTARKAQAVRAALLDPISTACPATLLRQHPRAHLFLDEAAAALLTIEERSSLIPAHKESIQDIADAATALDRINRRKSGTGRLLTGAEARRELGL